MPALTGKLRSDQGSTIVEVLIVALVLGILGMIALPLYTQMTSRADAADAETRINQGLVVSDLAWTSAEQKYPLDIGEEVGSDYPAAAVQTGADWVLDELRLERTSNQVVTLRTVGKNGEQLAIKRIASGPGRGVYKTRGFPGDPLYTNLIPNPSAESGGSRWTGANCDDEVSVRQAATGAQSYACTYGGAAQMAVGLFGKNVAPPLVGGSPHFVGAFVRSDSERTVRVCLRSFDAADVTQPEECMPWTTIAPNQWVWLSNSVVSPESAVKGGVIVRSQNKEGTMWVDGLLMVQTADQLPAYFDGDYPGAYWNGAVHGSSSTGPSRELW